MVVGGEVHRDGFGGAKDTRIGCISTRRVFPEDRMGDEMSGSGDEGEYVISFLLFWGRRELALFLCFPFVYLPSFVGRGREVGEGGALL